MASIEYAIDKNGYKIVALEASKYLTYKCPYCLESIVVRKGNVYVDYFAHSRIFDRTPLQRICPGYTGNEDFSSINHPVDKMYIDNGGIPLYLSTDSYKFELRAYFPTISDLSVAKLRKSNTKLCVNFDAKNDADKAEYSIDNLNYHKVDVIKPWIYVTCIPKMNLPEIRRKWLWGIRGIDLENDVYHSNKDGGYRVALKSNISVGKTYRMMFENNAPQIRGIIFNKIGYIKLKHEHFTTAIMVYVFSMEIISYTEETRSFVESKGYNLLENAIELLPLWPPAVFEGNNLKYEHSNAFFLHIDKVNKEKVFFTTLDAPIMSDEKNANVKIISVSTYNETITVSNSGDNSINEIKYHVSRVNSLINKPLIKLNLTVKDSNDNIFDFKNSYTKLPRDGKLFISSNLPFTAIAFNGNYVRISSNACFEKIRFFDELAINSRAFGILRYKYKPLTKINGMNKLDCEEIYLKLYGCSAPTKNAEPNDIKLLYLLSKSINGEYDQLYRLLEFWVKMNRIPLSAIEQLSIMKACLGGFSNEGSN